MNKAKKDKKVIEFKHIKVLLTGSSAAGKSSFCRLLFGSEEFSAEYNSTDIMENKQALSMVKQTSGKQNEAIAVESYTAVEQEGEVVWYKLDLEAQIQFLKSLLVQKKFQDQKVAGDCGGAGGDKPESNNNVDDGDKDDEMVDDDDNTPPETSQSYLEKEVVKAKPLPDSLTINTVKLITVMDSGGQPEYIHLLPAINSYPAVTFIIHDLNEKLDEKVNVYREVDGKKVKERSLNFSYLNLIHLLMCFVSDTMEKQPPEQAIPYISIPRKSYIGFVGTHYDDVKDNPNVLENINKKLNTVVEEREFKSGGVLCPEEGIIYAIENKTAHKGEEEDPAAKLIRKHIEDLITEEIESKTLPITWMILQLRIQQVCTTAHKGYISYEEYTEFAKEYLKSDEEVKASLAYFHFAGLLLYFKDPSLCNYVITNIQWLYSNLAKVMHLSSKDVTFRNYKNKTKFADKRLLSIRDHVIQLKDINEKDLPYFFDLLIHLKVIAKVSADGEDYFYLPCVLSSSEMCGDNCTKHAEILSEPLLIQFKSGFLPRGFFCFLVVHVLNEEGKKEKGWKHQLHLSAENYSDLMIFRLPDSSFLYMYDKIFYLQLELRHNKSDFASSDQPCVFPVLHEYLKQVCSHLCFNPQNLRCGFLCTANESDDDHIAIIDQDLSRISEFMQNKEKIIQCSRQCEDETELVKSHTIWFEHVSTFYGYYICTYC